MRKILMMLTLSMTGFLPLMGEWYDCLAAGCECDNNWPSPINMEFDVGYRRDRFKWSIAGLAVRNPFNDEITYVPSTLSELQWKDLRMVQYAGSASYVSCTNYAVKAHGSYAHIYHGRNIDSDFNDDESLEIQSTSKAGKGYVYDVDAGVGYRVTSTGGRFIAMPLIGYAYQGQHLNIYDTSILFNFLPPPFNFVGPVPGVHSTYQTRWFGPWIGLDFATRVEKCAYVFGGFAWHLVSYRGTGRWNLREREMSPFHHRAHGHGYVVTLGGNWEIWNNWSIGVIAHYRNFRTRHGRERVTIFVNELGESIPPTVVQTRFNQAKWIAVDVSAMIAWRF